MLIVKYATFRILFRRVGESAPFAHETGMRLAQASEFSLIVAVTAHANGWLNHTAFQFIELVTILSLVFSACVVTSRLPSSLASKKELKQD